MTDIIAFLRGAEELAFLGGATQEEIDAAETELNIHFAPDYKNYLKEYGLASADGHELTGLVNSPRLNVVDVTKKMRNRFSNTLSDVYVIEEIGVDGVVIFQNYTGSVFMATPKMELVKVASSIVEYLTKTI